MTLQRRQWRPQLMECRGISKIMPTVTENCAYWLLRLLQLTPFRGNCNSFATARNASVSPAAQDDFPQARMEASNFPEFIGYFKDHRPVLKGAVVLDLGSGYGGKTVEMASALGLAKVVGIEPHEMMVGRCVLYAESVGATNCEFRHCGHLEIPAADREFDAIVSHDVIEHVEDPRAKLAEMQRVLKSNGMAYVIFTPYWGALAHHLGYVTRAPFIHWIFSPKTLVNAINRILSGDNGKRFGTAQQPVPQKSYDGRFDVLPTLNGIGGEDFLALARQNNFEVVYVRYPSIVERFLPRTWILIRLNEALMGLHPFLKEALSFNLTCILRKKPH